MVSSRCSLIIAAFAAADLSQQHHPLLGAGTVGCHRVSHQQAHHCQRHHCPSWCLQRCHSEPRDRRRILLRTAHLELQRRPVRGRARSEQLDCDGIEGARHRLLGHQGVSQREAGQHQRGRGLQRRRQVEDLRPLHRGRSVTLRLDQRLVPPRLVSASGSVEKIRRCMQQMALLNLCIFLIVPCTLPQSWRRDPVLCWRDVQSHRAQLHQQHVVRNQRRLWGL